MRSRKVSCSKISKSILKYGNFYRYRDLLYVKISLSEIYLHKFCQLKITYNLGAFDTSYIEYSISRREINIMWDLVVVFLLRLYFIPFIRFVIDGFSFNLQRERIQNNVDFNDGSPTQLYEAV